MSKVLQCNCDGDLATWAEATAKALGMSVSTWGRKGDGALFYPEVGEAIFSDQEDVLAIVASLGDVMRCTDRYHPRLAGHR